MIRINLIRADRKKERRPKIKAVEPSKTVQQLGFVGVFVILVAGIGLLWLDINGQKDYNQRQLNEAQKKLNRLVKVEKVKEKAERLERQKTNLTRHLESLTQLKDNQRTPLYPLAHIFYALQIHQDVSFTEIKPMEVESGMGFVITGEGTDESLRRFMATLQEYKLTKAIRLPSVDNIKQTFVLPVVFISDIDLRKAAAAPEQQEQ